MNEWRIEPLDVITVGINDEHLVRHDRDGQEEHRPDGHGKWEGAEPGADPVDGHLVLVRAVVVLATVPAVAAQQAEAGQVEQQEQQQEYLN